MNPIARRLVWISGFSLGFALVLEWHWQRELARVTHPCVGVGLRNG